MGGNILVPIILLRKESQSKGGSQERALPFGREEKVFILGVQKISAVPIQEPKHHFAQQLRRSRWGRVLAQRKITNNAYQWG